VQRSRQGRHLGPLLALPFLLVACGGDAVSAPTIAAGPLPAGVARPLTADDLANDAVDRSQLLSLLEDAGFGSANEVVGADRAAGIHQAAARVVAFDDDDGAESYLTWLGDHAGEVIGEAEVVGEIHPPGADRTIGVFRHEPGDCCPKATVAYLTAWRDDALVITLQLAGPSVRPGDVADAADRIELAREP
jgi:hypothetical protein